MASSVLIVASGAGYFNHNRNMGLCLIGVAD